MQKFAKSVVVNYIKDLLEGMGQIQWMDFEFGSSFLSLRPLKFSNNSGRQEEKELFILSWEINRAGGGALFYLIIQKTEIQDF